ncbi:hypothetical protein FA95DRAFT_1469483, partial [Auriscalpium vulgare]
DVKALPELIKTHFKTWKDGAKPFQLEAMEAQLLGRDCIIHAATGAGKTGIAAGPHLAPSSKGKVTLFVSPLIALQNEQVSVLQSRYRATLRLLKVDTFKTEFGLSAVAINSAHGGCTKSLMKV